ncbi:MAG: 5,6-dimethylbenzimidazole synthase [Steroidobacteraceae bacterium]
MSDCPHRYDEAARAAVYRVIRERRDVRSFLRTPVDPETLARILQCAHAAPSVGLSQPWRFLHITRPELRQDIHALVQQERLRTAEALGQRREEFLRLKVEGILDCAELLVVALLRGGKREIFGRRTLPEMDLASVACAVQNLWLAARAEGLGVGWVSMFDPYALAELLHFPPAARPVAILCIGNVAQFDPAPRLVIDRWRQPRPLEELLFENGWPQGAE